MVSFEAVFRSSADALILHDGEKLLDCNDAALRLFGAKEQAALLGTRLRTLLAGEELQPAPRADDGAASLQRFRTLDGQFFLADASTSRLPAADGGIFCLSLRRTTETEAMQRALEARESNLRLVFDAVPGRMAWIGADRRFRYVNRSFERLSGFAPEEVIGRTVPEIIGPAAYEAVEPLGAAAMAGEVQHWEGWLPYTAGGRRFVRRTYAPSHRDDGVIDGYFVFSLDLTEQKQAEQELEIQREALHQSEKLNALGSLLAGVAHELNNPLAVVLTQATLLKEKARDPDTERRGERIYAAAERCARIVRSFLAIARQKPPMREPVQVAALIESALELTAYGLRANGIEVSIEPPSPGVTILGDADHLAQVFMNLLVNAQHALQEVTGERRVCIRTTEEDGQVVIRVSDNGPGIAQEVASRIFEPFFTTKPHGVGTGIGLSVCRGIVDAHGGTLRVEATPGGGATFLIRLPTAPNTAEDATAQLQSAGAEPLARAILVVDDEPDIGEVISEIVGPLAARVDVVESGRAALDRLSCESYDLIISDMRMPELDGPALYEHLRESGATPRCPILFVTGDTLGHRVEEFLERAAARVVEKPFEPQTLREEVIAVLTQARVHQGR